MQKSFLLLLLCHFTHSQHRKHYAAAVAGPGTETANLCNRYCHWDMQMMRWIFIVAATFLFHSFFSSAKPERCRLYLNECRRYKNIQATVPCATYSCCCCWQGICTNQIANIRWTEYDKCSSFKCKRHKTREGVERPWDDIWNIKINNLLSERYQIFRDLANSSVAWFSSRSREERVGVVSYRRRVDSLNRSLFDRWVNSRGISHGTLS